MPKKLSYNDVDEYIKQNGYLLLDKIYKDSKTKLKMICDKGHRCEISFNSFKSGTRCSECYGNSKYSYEYVKQYIEIDSNSNCKLISKDYVNTTTNLYLHCACGEIFKCTFNNFRTFKQYKCSKCTGKTPYTYDEVKNFIEIKSNSGCKLLSKTYKNSNTNLKLKCVCGNIFYRSYVKFKNNGSYYCRECTSSKGEIKIKSFLANNNITYSHEYSFENLLSEKNNELRFDFAIFTDFNKTNLRCLIEFDGEQHYKWIKKWMTKKEFETLQLHDSFKNTYCKNNNICLLRIRFDEYEDIEKILQCLLNLL